MFSTSRLQLACVFTRETVPLMKHVASGTFVSDGMAGRRVCGSTNVVMPSGVVKGWEWLMLILLHEMHPHRACISAPDRPWTGSLSTHLVVGRNLENHVIAIPVQPHSLSKSQTRLFDVPWRAAGQGWKVFWAVSNVTRSTRLIGPGSCTSWLAVWFGRRLFTSLSLCFFCL